MSYTLRYSPESIKDMEKVWDDVYAASVDVTISDNYVSDFISRIEEKVDFPTTGIPLYYDKYMFTGYYYVILKSYLAFYRIRNEYMEVARILPSKMD